MRENDRYEEIVKGQLTVEEWLNGHKPLKIVFLWVIAHILVFPIVAQIGGTFPDLTVMALCGAPIVAGLSIVY